MGDLLDRSADLSKERASQNGGVDPVKEKYYKEYSKKRNGALHEDKKPTSFENKHIKVELWAYKYINLIKIIEQSLVKSIKVFFGSPLEKYQNFPNDKLNNREWIPKNKIYFLLKYLYIKIHIYAYILSKVSETLVLTSSKLILNFPYWILN